MIDKSSPIPIYYQLEEVIKNLIEKGELNPGDSIPSEREFSEKYLISRMTVRQAIMNLVNDGYLIRKQGKGTYVAKQKIEQKLQQMTSFSEDMRARGMEPSTTLLSFQTLPADPILAASLGIDEGAPIYEVKRVRLADGIPMAHEISYLSKELIPDLSHEAVTHSLYKYIEEQLGLRIGHATQVLEASISRKSESEILDIPDRTPVLLIKRYSFLADGRPLEMVKSVYRGDRYKFVIEMQRNDLEP